MNSAAKTIALNDKFAHCSLNNHEQNEQSHMGRESVIETRRR